MSPIGGTHNTLHERTVQALEVGNFPLLRRPKGKESVEKQGTQKGSMIPKHMGCQRNILHLLGRHVIKVVDIDCRLRQNLHHGGLVICYQGNAFAQLLQLVLLKDPPLAFKSIVVGASRVVTSEDRQVALDLRGTTENRACHAVHLSLPP